MNNMKILIIFALAVTTAFAFTVAPSDIVLRNVVVPVEGHEGRITNGQDAEEGQFPYQVGLSLRRNTMSFWCGGSLIGAEWVLTAAHCTDGMDSVTVYLGATVRTSAEVTYTVGKRDIIVHSGWNPILVRNDISLIRIPTTEFTDKIQPVQLPAIASSYSSYAGQSGIASGWGRVSDSASEVATNLQWARMPVITNFRCKLTFPIITKSHLCLDTSDRTSTCNGDSGGPLVLEDGGIQIGLTSFGSSAGCEKRFPAAFTRITSYLEWIQSNTGIAY